SVSHRRKMKMPLIAAAMGLAVSFPFACSGGSPDSAHIVAKIVGIWMVHPDEYGRLLKAGIQTFRADKTFTDVGAFGSGSRHLDAQVEGRWWIEGDVLCEDVTKSSLPEAV